MKGVLLCGGLGTRLRPLTSVVNKHLLPVFDKPMLFYGLEMFAEARIKEVMIVVGGQSTEEIMKLCKNGSEWGLHLYYTYQEGEGGIAAALALAGPFVGSDEVCVILGDNILLGESLREHASRFLNREHTIGASVLLAHVTDPKNYGVPRFSSDGKRILKIIEKPLIAPSNWAVIGIYFYDCTVWDRIMNCKRSARNELEISDVNNSYAENEMLDHCPITGEWIDAGSSIEALVKAGKIVENALVRKG